MVTAWSLFLTTSRNCCVLIKTLKETNREKWTNIYCIHYHQDTDTVESCFNSLSTIWIFLNFMKAFFYLINSHFADTWISTDFLKKCYYVLILFLSQQVLETHRLMHKKSYTFVYILAVNFPYFQISPLVRAV